MELSHRQVDYVREIHVLQIKCSHVDFEQQEGDEFGDSCGPVVSTCVCYGTAGYEEHVVSADDWRRLGAPVVKPVQVSVRSATGDDMKTSDSFVVLDSGTEKHGGLWFIWPLGGHDENSIDVSGSVRTMKEMIQRQKDAAVTLDIEFSIEHSLFTLMVTDKPQEFLGRSLYKFGV